MAIPLSVLANAKMLITKPFLNQILVESLMSDFSSVPVPDVLVAKTVCHSLDGAIATNDLSEVDDQKEVVFYHPINGYVSAYPRWELDMSTWEWKRLFSTLQFIQNLKEAEASSNVVAHFLHINSGGGEAWALDVAVETMRDCKKPIYAFVERACMSAAYYLACNAQVIKTFTHNDQIGSIGAMTSFIDMSAQLEKSGIKEIDLYASRSDLKNRRELDVLADRPDQFIKECLDPLQSQFEAAVRAGRPQLNSLPDDSPVFRGAMFSASEAQNVGLVDGVVSDLGTALCEAYELGKSIKTNNQLLTKI